MEHHFDIDIATEYGVTEAILLNNLWFWVKKNEANEAHFHDGSYWTYSSVKAMVALHPYLSEKKIRNALNHLKDEGVILTGNYNKSPYDRTAWYAFTEKGISIMPKGQMKVDERANQSHQKGEPIPYIRKYKNQLTEDIYIDPEPVTQCNVTVTQQNKNKSIEDIYSDLPEELQEALKDFEEMRKKMKAPMTDKARELLLNKLEKLSGGDTSEKVRLLENAIEHSWKSVYPIKENEYGQNLRGNVGRRNDSQRQGIPGTARGSYGEDLIVGARFPRMAIGSTEEE